MIQPAVVNKIRHSVVVIVLVASISDSIRKTRKSVQLVGVSHLRTVVDLSKGIQDAMLSVNNDRIKKYKIVNLIWHSVFVPVMDTVAGISNHIVVSVLLPDNTEKPEL